MSSHRRFTAVFLSLLALASAGLIARDEPLRITVAPEHAFVYAGTPIRVEVLLRNPGDEKRTNPVEGSLFASLEVSGPEGKTLETRADPKLPRGPRNVKRIDARGEIRGTVDLAELFSGLDRPGTYRVRWAEDGLESDWSEIRVLPDYDPRRRYVATVVTDMGDFTIELLPALAPLGVKAVVDLARANHYDGLTVDEVDLNSWILLGKPGTVDPPRQHVLLPAEPASFAPEAGAVLLRPQAPAPPANDTALMVLLEPRPEWAGQVTQVGRITSGLGVLHAMSRTQTPEGGTKPWRTIRVRTVTIEETEAGPTP